MDKGEGIEGYKYKGERSEDRGRKGRDRVRSTRGKNQEQGINGRGSS